MILLALAILLAITGALIRSAIKVENAYVDHRKAGTILMVSGLIIGVLAAAFIALHVALAHHDGNGVKYRNGGGPGPVFMQHAQPGQ